MKKYSNFSLFGLLTQFWLGVIEYSENYFKWPPKKERYVVKKRIIIL